MQIERHTIKTEFDGSTCFTHARGVMREDGYGLITTQPLRLTGSDVFYGIHITETFDGGRSWSPLRESRTLVRQSMDDGSQTVLCDATPMLHKKTGRILLLGHTASYVNDELMRPPRPRYTAYTVYDEQTRDFRPITCIGMPQDEAESYFSCGNGSGQSLELENGELLIPVYYMNRQAARDPWHSCYCAAVMRCAFDGECLRFLEMGDPLTVGVPRGLCEPSLVRCEEGYLLALRNDVTGYVARSRDGLSYSEPVELVFDDGANAGNYCTQQHWLVGGGRVYMVYTRRGADNDNVFRHRAPLFVARYDPGRMCLVRDTEQIVVPNRGARLGNFGAMSMEDGRTGYVFASEWMQTLAPDSFDWKRCASYGSDNSIFVCRLSL